MKRIRKLNYDIIHFKIDHFRVIEIEIQIGF